MRLSNLCLFCAALAFPLVNVPLTGAQEKPAYEQPRVVKGERLAGTEPLDWEGDIASRLVSGVDRFLLREIEQSTARRARHWHRDLSSAAAYNTSITPNRERLTHILGMREQRKSISSLELLATTEQSALVGRTKTYDVFAVRWDTFGDVHGEGLLAVPRSQKAVANVIAIPDADQLPEQILGLVAGVAPESQFARRLAESGCRVLIPMLVSRERDLFTWGGGRKHGLTGREFLYRPAFLLGRHLVGYEVQKVLAGVDWFAKEGGDEARIGVVGYGEGGMLALYAGALDPRIDAVCVSGHFDSRNGIWQQPIDRNVQGLLDQFGDAELAAMIAPRSLTVEAAKGPAFTLPPGTRGAPAKLTTPVAASVKKEVQRAEQLVAGLPDASTINLVVSVAGGGPAGTKRALQSFLSALSADTQIAPAAEPAKFLRSGFDPHVRLERQMRELDRHSQQVLLESEFTRAEYMKGLDSSSIETYEKTAEPYRDAFRNEVIGHFDQPLLPARPRSRRAYDAQKWTGYEVVLDVFPDVVAYGLLLVPKDIKPAERRPVVVCQHGLEGRPQMVIGKDGYHYYKAFAAKLADRGFITFAPQNLYIFQDRFRTLQRKANPLGKTLFSVIVPQHQQIVDWLQTLSMVDGERIGFYGLSYGGKSAMRIPALVKDYKLSICSADFNEWVSKNASTRDPYSYVWSGEYEIFEFDLGSTFNYAEMAALIAPRPFMVERGHFDGVAADHTVAREFAKVRFLYAARLHLPERCQIEWFDGPHTINEKGTFDFLHRHLDWAVQRQ